jgi:hypothetical protein
MERREQVTLGEIESTVTGGTHCLAARRQPFKGGTSRINREIHVRLCERLGVKFPGCVGGEWVTTPPMPI